MVEYMRGTPQQRLEAKCLPEPMSGCWLWEGCVKKGGYGYFFMGNDYAPSKTQAHRAAWLIYRGPTFGMDVLHRCDNPACVNPDHLFLGTDQDNVDDKMAKGRQAIMRGERNPRARLNAEKASAIRADQRETRFIAAEYGISRQAVQRIRSGKAWGDD
jgi:hypothetical protein